VGGGGVWSASTLLGPEAIGVPSWWSARVSCWLVGGGLRVLLDLHGYGSWAWCEPLRWVSFVGAGAGVGVPVGSRVRPLLENCTVDASIPDVQYWSGRRVVVVFGPVAALLVGLVF